MGDLVLRTSRPIIKGVNAWVEIDGQRRTSWAVGDTQVQIALATGTYRVTVYSIYQGAMKTIYNNNKVTVTGGDTLTIDVGPK
jgi:hypothetical protein